MLANLLALAEPSLCIDGAADRGRWAPPEDVDCDPIGWADLEPSGVLLDAIAAHPVDKLTVETLLDRVHALERIAAKVAAEQAIAMSAFAAACRVRVAEAEEHGLPEHEIEPARQVADELSLELHISSRTADARLETAADLTRLPGTLAALQAGKIGVGHAYAIRDETLQLSEADIEEVEARILRGADRATPGQLRRRARRAVLSVNPDAAIERRKRASKQRRVELYPDTDGMATLRVQLPAPDAVAVYNRLNEYAQAAKARGDQRTLDQLRADALVEILCHGAGSAAKPLIQITVGADTLAGRDNNPAELDGYGPIDADLARHITATGTWQRVLTDPATGQVVDVGRKRYRPPKALADYVRARDQHCYFPTCSMPASRCDLDHLVPWSAGGRTDASNLGAGCPRHHDRKHNPDWQLKRHADGSYTVTTPTKRQHTAPPPTPYDDEPPF